ncbi:MAG: FtsX-like permease family protein [Acidobacteria bacterium]|nr:FtsX-like permease family protein [Acidobacteriota bacterium]
MVAVHVEALSAVPGFVGVLIAAIGLYGVMAHEVAGRIREIGIRIALGANSWDIMRTTIREAPEVAGLGVLAGIHASIVGDRLVEPLLYEVPTGDPITFAAASVLLAFAALIVALGPARRASRLDPVQSLRGE